MGHLTHNTQHTPNTQQKSIKTKQVAIHLNPQLTNESIHYLTPIPPKSLHVSPMDFCDFGLLKRTLNNRRPLKLWKVAEDERENPPMLIF